MKKPRVVIIGGGFGGIYTAKYLLSAAERGELELILINKTNHFLFTPLLHEVATGGLSPLSVVEPLREIFRHRKITFRQTTVTKIQTEAKQVITENEVIDYDYLVLATGAETNFYDIPGASKHSLTLKNLPDALKIRSQILDVCEAAALAKDPETKKRLLSFVIVGGGATGVEVAGEVAEFVKKTICAYYRYANFNREDVKVVLINRSSELLPQWPQKIRHGVEIALVNKGVEVKTNSTVKEVTSDAVVLENGQRIMSGTTIWVAGVKPVPPQIVGLQHDEQGRVVVDEFLRAKDRPNIFVLGDTACFKSTHQSKPLPMLAQIATQQAKTVAKNIKRQMTGLTPKPYQPMLKGMLISVGQWFGAGEILGFYLEGRFMWWLWRTIYLFNFLSWRKRFRIAAEWTINLFYPRDISKII